MKSRKFSRLLDLDRDLPTSAEDIVALRRARLDTIRDLEAYLNFLSGFTASSTPALDGRKGPGGRRPFEL